MKVLTIWEFLTSTEPVGPFGPTISWLPILVGETEIPPQIRTGEFCLGEIMEVFPSLGVVTSITVRIKSLGVREMHAPLRATSVTITFEVGVWPTCVVPLPTATPSETSGLIGGMMTGMVRLINNFCADFLLVVSVSVTFLFFPSLV